MSEVYDRTIIMKRGDSFYSDVELYDAEGEPYIPQTGDVITFSAAYNETPVLTKPVEDLELIFVPEDTASLPVGIYDFDIDIVTALGKKDTFLSGTLVLEQEV